MASFSAIFQAFLKQTAEEEIRDLVTKIILRFVITRCEVCPTHQMQKML